MDEIPLPDWAARLLSSHYETYTTLSPYLLRAYTLLSTARTYALTLLTHITAKPDLATLALLLLILFLSLKILDLLWQTVVFWVRLARRVVFWGGLVVVGVWVWRRGVEGVGEDVGFWWGVWEGERERWVERERVARLAAEARGVGGGGQRAWA